MNQTDCRGADASECAFFRCELEQADFRQAACAATAFVECRAPRIDFSGTTLKSCHFTQTVLTGAQLEGVVLHEGSYSECPLDRSEEHTSELQSLMRISYAVFCLKKKTITASTQKPKNS